MNEEKIQAVEKQISDLKWAVGYHEQKAREAKILLEVQQEVLERLRK